MSDTGIISNSGRLTQLITIAGRGGAGGRATSTQSGPSSSTSTRSRLCEMRDPESSKIRGEGQPGECDEHDNGTLAAPAAKHREPGRNREAQDGTDDRRIQRHGRPWRSGQPRQTGPAGGSGTQRETLIGRTFVGPKTTFHVSQGTPTQNR